MQLARQMSLDELDATVDDDDDWAMAKNWLRQGLGVGIFEDEETFERHLISFGNLSGLIPSKWPPSHYGTSKLAGWVGAGTAVPKEPNQALKRLGPSTAERWR